jgi:hypothetical protein
VITGGKKLTEQLWSMPISNPFSWLNDNATILVKCFLKNRAALLDAKKDSNWSVISNADGAKSQNRTYRHVEKQERRG